MLLRRWSVAVMARDRFAVHLPYTDSLCPEVLYKCLILLAPPRGIEPLFQP